MSRRFLLVAHTGRSSSLNAVGRVVHDLLHAGIEPVVLAWQLQEIRDADPTIVPDGLERVLTETALVVDTVKPGHAIELTLVLGGDGTILRALEVVREVDIPVHGVNLGHVGFLAESEVEGLTDTVDRLATGRYEVEERTALEMRVLDENGLETARDWALNECALEKSNRRMMIEVVLEIDGRPVSTFGCDGVLAATPTGSTAYSFSAGGPVVWPEVDAFIVVPLSAHALFARPLVLGRSSVLAIEILPQTTSQAVLWMDGRRCHDAGPGTRIECRVSPTPVRLVRLYPTPFADRLVSKFELPVEGWRGPGPAIEAAGES